MKRLRVLVLLHPELVPPDSLEGHSAEEIHEWKTEYDVVSTLRAAGHDVRPLGVQHELKPIRDAVEDWKPNVVFNLLEEFHGEAAYDQKQLHVRLRFELGGSIFHYYCLAMARQRGYILRDHFDGG